MSEAVGQIRPIFLCGPFAKYKTIGEDEVTALGPIFGIRDRSLAIREIVLFLFDRMGLFYVHACGQALQVRDIQTQISSSRTRVLATYQALLRERIDEYVRSLLQGRSSYAVSFSEERRRLTYDCLLHLPMPVQQIDEILATKPKTFIHPDDIQKLRDEQAAQLQKIFQIFDDLASDQPTVYAFEVLEKYCYTRGALANLVHRTGDIAFTNWRTLLNEWDAQQRQLDEEDLQRARRQSRMAPMGCLENLTETEPRREIRPHEEIDQRLRTRGLPFKAHYIYSAIREMQYNIDVPLTGEVLQMLYEELAENPSVCLELLYFTCLETIPLEGLRIDETSLKWLRIFRRFKVAKGWIYPDERGFDPQKLRVWITKGKWERPKGEILNAMAQNGVASFSLTEKVVESLGLPVESALEIFLIVLFQAERGEMPKALETVHGLLQRKRIEAKNPDFWVSLCRRLAPWNGVENYGRHFEARMGETPVTDIRDMESLVLLFLGGVVEVFERGMQETVAPENLLEALKTIKMEIPLPLMPDHVRHCLNYLHAGARYEWSQTQKLALLFNYLALPHKPELIRANYEQLCWMEKFSFCLLPAEHAYDWLFYHPEPNTVWAIFHDFERLQGICNAQYLEAVTIPERFKEEFVQCRRAFKDLPSAIHELADHDGFQNANNVIRNQIAFPVLSTTSQWWTELFTYKAFVGGAAGEHNPRTEHFIGAVTPFGGSRKYTCCNWFTPPSVQADRSDRSSIFEIRVITDFGTRTVRKRFPLIEDQMNEDAFQKEIKAHALFFGEESAEERYRPARVDATLQRYFEELRVACRKIWKKPIAPLPFSTAIYKLDCDQLAAEGNVYPIDRRFSLIPPDLLTTPADYERYTVGEECDEQVGLIETLVRTTKEGTLQIDDLRVQYNPLSIQQDDADAPPYYLHELTLSQEANVITFRYPQLAGGRNFRDWIRWHLVQLKARSFQRRHPC